jgi:hypothetical protein
VVSLNHSATGVPSGQRSGCLAFVFLPASAVVAAMSSAMQKRSFAFICLVVFSGFCVQRYEKKDGRHKKTMHFVRKTFNFQKK